MGLFSGLGGYLFGVPPVSSAPYQAQAQQLQSGAGQFAGQEQSAYNGQEQLADSLWNRINGTGGPSVADVRLQQALGQGLAQTQATGAGASGENSVLARYLAARAGGDQAAQAAQSGALLKAQETEAAQQQLGQVRAQQAGEGSNMYGTNLSTGLGYSNLTNQVNEANAARQQSAQNALLGAAAGAVGGLGGLGAMYFKNRLTGGGGGGSSGGSSEPGGDAFAPGGTYGGGLSSSDQSDYDSLSG